MRDEQGTAELLATVHTGGLAEIRIRRRRFKDREYLDLRIWREPDNSQERIPTRKGVCVRWDLLPELLEALRQAEGMTAHDAGDGSDVDTGGE